LPVRAKPLTHDVRAGQRHEEHYDGGESHLERREIGAPRHGTPRTWRAAIVIAARRRAGTAIVTGVDDLDIFSDCSWHGSAFWFLRLAHQIRREMLRDVIVRSARHAEFVRSVIHHRFDAS